MTSVNKYFLMLFSLLAVGLTACQDKWDDHTALSEAVLNEGLILQIQANPSLSKFNEYLVQTQYDQLLASSKTFTVWAPTNEALANLDPAIVSDPARLKNFIGNHISYQRYFSGPASVRVKTLSGKYLSWVDNKLDGVAVEASAVNQYAANGVVHVLTGLAAPRPNIYTFITGSTLGAKQAAYIQSRNFMDFNPDEAEIDHIDPATGKPVYKPGTGLFPRNTVFERTVDIQREDSLYTQILLTDAAFDAEYNKISRFFTYPASDTMADLTSFHLVKDLVFRGMITPENLPDTLVSLYGVKVPIDKGAIVQTVQTSNGMVYVMNKVDFRIQDKVPPILVEGELPWFFTQNRPDNTHRRYRTWASNMLDIRVSGHGVSGFTVYYQAPKVYATKYKVYWRVVNEFQDAAVRQRLGMGRLQLPNNTFTTLFPFQDFARTTNPAGVKEVYVGDYTLDQYGPLALGMLANGTGPLELDYIKLVPVY
jgi:uncharacterized surface protein with fasciclin (FAS1) repeats